MENNTEQTVENIDETLNAEPTNHSTEEITDNTTEEVLEEPIDELTKATNDLAEQKDKYLRLFAEFDNFKKRNAKERLELFKTAGQEIIREMIPVLDDFQRAEKVYATNNDNEQLAKGALLIKEKLQKALQSKGLKAIESIGQDFNVEYHEAIAEIPAATKELKGKVIDEIESGYSLNDVIIRYAKVVVGK